MAYPVHEIVEEESFNMALPFRISLTSPQVLFVNGKGNIFKIPQYVYFRINLISS